MYAINERSVVAPDVEQWEAYELGVDHTGRIRRSPYMRLTWTKRVDDGCVDWRNYEGQAVRLTTRAPGRSNEFATYDAVCQRVVAVQQRSLLTDVVATFLVHVG